MTVLLPWLSGHSIPFYPGEDRGTDTGGTSVAVCLRTVDGTADTRPPRGDINSSPLVLPSTAERGAGVIATRHLTALTLGTMR